MASQAHFGFFLFLFLALFALCSLLTSVAAIHGVHLPEEITEKCLPQYHKARKDCSTGKNISYFFDSAHDMKPLLEGNWTSERCCPLWSWVDCVKYHIDSAESPCTKSENLRHLLKFDETALMDKGCEWESFNCTIRFADDGKSKSFELKQTILGLVSVCVLTWLARFSLETP